MEWMYANEAAAAGAAAAVATAVAAAVTAAAATAVAARANCSILDIAPLLPSVISMIRGTRNG
jgi:hypothetical protein